MIEEVVEGFFKFAARIIGQIFIELIFEILIKGPGYFIVKLFSVEAPDTDSARVIFTGVLFWLLIGFGSYGVYSAVSSSI